MSALSWLSFLQGRMLSEAARRRWSVASRTVAASVGGYALTSLVTVVVPLLLGAAGVSVSRALYAMTMASFLFYAAVVMAVFHARSATRAWLWLAGMALPLGVITLLLRPGSAA